MERHPEDYKVPPLSWEQIAAIANKTRGFFLIGSNPVTKITTLVEQLAKRTFKDGFTLRVSLFECQQGQTPARVRVNHEDKTLILFVDKETWDWAADGDPDSMWKIAHELGHILLHRVKIHAFSNSLERKNSFIIEEESSEWQANAFAFHFMIPDRLVQSLGTAKAIARHCNVEEIIAEKRISEFRRRDKYR